MRLSTTSPSVHSTKTLPSPRDQAGSTAGEMLTPHLQSRIVLRDTRGEVPTLKSEMPRPRLKPRMSHPSTRPEAPKETRFWWTLRSVFVCAPS